MPVLRFLPVAFRRHQNLQVRNGDSAHPSVHEVSREVPHGRNLRRSFEAGGRCSPAGPPKPGHGRTKTPASNGHKRTPRNFCIARARPALRPHGRVRFQKKNKKPEGRGGVLFSRASSHHGRMSTLGCSISLRSILRGSSRKRPCFDQFRSRSRTVGNGRKVALVQWARMVSNQRPLPCQGQRQRGLSL